MLVALTRAVPPSIARCELTHLQRVPIDLSKAEAQHAAYEAALEAAGCTVVRLPAEPDLPDSVFIEDTAVVLDEVAIVTRPGAESRRSETPSVAAALQQYRPVRYIEAPGTMDGGDVLRVGRRIVVGLTRRTNASAVDQLRKIATPFGYSVETLAPRGCLHLKSAATAVGDDAVLVNPNWITGGSFVGFDVVTIDPREPLAANVVQIGSTIIGPAAAVRTRELLAARGLTVVPIDMSELAKAEGALTCCSVIVSGARGRASGVSSVSGIRE